MLYLLACELHFVLVLRMAKQTHTSQTEPKDRAVALQECDVFWTDKQKEKIKSGCDTQCLKVVLYNYPIIYLALFQHSQCSCHFGERFVYIVLSSILTSSLMTV